MNKEKELALRKQMGDKAYYRKKLEDDRMTLKILRVLCIILAITTVIIVGISVAVSQYFFTIGWLGFTVLLVVAGVWQWQVIIKRRQEYLDAYSKNEIQKESKKGELEKLPKDVKEIKPKKR